MSTDTEALSEAVQRLTTLPIPGCGCPVCKSRTQQQPTRKKKNRMPAATATIADLPIAEAVDAALLAKTEFEMAMDALDKERQEALKQHYQDRDDAAKRCVLVEAAYSAKKRALRLKFKAVVGNSYVDTNYYSYEDDDE